MRLRMVLLLGLVICLGGACTKQPKQLTPAFYHWKNTLALSQSERAYLQDLQIKKIYLRFFDVDMQDGAAVPIAILESSEPLPDSIELVPTVFITNRTMLHTPADQIPALSKKIYKKIGQLKDQFERASIREVQFDCDWSANSKTNYFSLLKQLQNQFEQDDWKISATIRLHQIKYRQKTGVPPVDRGVLMFYNMDKLDDPGTENSIINLPLARSYLENASAYPLPLDLALPIFKWGLVFQEGRFVKIINNLDSRDLQDSSRFIKTGENQFELNKSTYLKGHYLYRQDRIRLEYVSENQLTEAAKLLSQKIVNEDLNLIFYHLDSTLIADYPHEILEAVYHHFR